MEKVTQRHLHHLYTLSNITYTCIYTWKTHCGFYMVTFFWHAYRMNANTVHCGCPSVKHSELHSVDKKDERVGTGQTETL